MKRRLLTITGTPIKVRHFHHFFMLNPSRLRKLSALALIILFVLVPLLTGRTSAKSSAVSVVMNAPSAPPQGDCSGRIVFSSLRAGNFEIYVMNADGSNR